jgi:hypothetical protein
MSAADARAFTARLYRLQRMAFDTKPPLADKD